MFIKPEHKAELDLLKDTNRDLRISFDQLSALQGLSAKISIAKTHEDIIQSVTEVIPEIIPCHSCQIYELVEGRFCKIGGALYNSETTYRPADQDMMYWCCNRSTVSVHPGESEDLGSAIAPLLHGEDIIGAIVIDLGKFYTSFSEITGLSLTTIANQTALAISSHRTRTQLEEKAVVLKDIQEYTTSVLASITHPLISINPDGTVKVFNRKAEELFELRSKIVLGQPYRVVFPEYLYPVFDQLLPTIQKGEIPKPFELSFATLYKSENHTLITAAPLNISGTNKKGMVCVCQDLAMSKEVERLKELDQLKDHFIALVSHELKTPVTSIIAYTETLREGLATNKTEENQYLEVIHSEAKRLAHWVNDILDLSMIESGKMVFTKEPFKPIDLLEVGVKSAKKLCQKKNQRLLVEVPEGLPVLKGDIKRLTQVLLNLVSNAVKFTQDSGTIELGAKLEKPQKGTQRVKFYVRDNGIGIKERDFPKVFDKFSQVEDVNHHSEGMGLGMPISREILKMHGSDLLLQSVLGSGTKFSFVVAEN